MRHSPPQMLFSMDMQYTPPFLGVACMFQAYTQHIQYRHHLYTQRRTCSPRSDCCQAVMMFSQDIRYTCLRSLPPTECYTCCLRNRCMTLQLWHRKKWNIFQLDRQYTLQALSCFCKFPLHMWYTHHIPNPNCMSHMHTEYIWHQTQESSRDRKECK